MLGELEEESKAREEGEREGRREGEAWRRRCEEAVGEQARMYVLLFFSFPFFSRAVLPCLSRDIIRA